MSTHDFTDEWTKYWDKRRKEYYTKSVVDSIDYIIENYTMNNAAAPNSSATDSVVVSLESGELPVSPERKKHRRRRSKSHRRHKSFRKRSKSRHRRRVSNSPRHRSVTPSDRSSSIERRRRRRSQSKSPAVTRHRPSGRSRSRTRRCYSPIDSPKKISSSFELGRRHRSRSKSSAIRREKIEWKTPKHCTASSSDHSSSIDRRRGPSGSRSRSISPFEGRLRSRGRSRNKTWTSNDLRFSIENRRKQRDHSNSLSSRNNWPRDHSKNRTERSSKFSPITSSDHSASIERRQLRRSRSNSPIAKRFSPIGRPPSKHLDQYKSPRNSPTASDSGQFSSDAQPLITAKAKVLENKWKLVPFVCEDNNGTMKPTPPKTINLNVSSSKQSTVKEKISNIVAVESMSSKLGQMKTIPATSIAPLSSILAIPTIHTHPVIPTVPAIPTHPANLPIKSILKKPSVSKENAFAKAIRMLSSSNSNMQQFYDKIKLKTVVDASTRVLKYLSDANQSGSYPDYIGLDVTLLSAQVRNMLEFIAIDPSKLTDEQVQILMNKYMRTMRYDKDIGIKKKPAAKFNGGGDAQSVQMKSKPSPSNVNTVNEALPIHEPNAATVQTMSAAQSTIKSKIDRTTLLNDIVPSKVFGQPSTSSALKPNPRDPRIRASINVTNDQKTDCHEVVDMEIEQKSDCLQAVDMDIEYTCGETEAESDDECLYVGTYAIEKDQ